LKDIVVDKAKQIKDVASSAYEQKKEEAIAKVQGTAPSTQPKPLTDKEKLDLAKKHVEQMPQEKDTKVVAVTPIKYEEPSSWQGIKYTSIGAAVGLTAGALLARRAPKPLFIGAGAGGALVGGYGMNRYNARRERLAFEYAVRQSKQTSKY